jgi:uncharacterized DUF497 family protein
MKYEWDHSKEKLNISKHGISFSEAREALTCGLVIVLREDDSKIESTFVYLGMCKKLNVIVVVVTYPEEEITRIISARKANKKERKFYEEKL